MVLTIYARQVGGHVSQKSRILLTEVGSKNIFDIKHTKHYYVLCSGTTISNTIIDEVFKKCTTT